MYHLVSITLHNRANITSNNSYYNDGNYDMKSLCATALTSEDETNCAIKQENVTSAVQIRRLVCDGEFHEKRLPERCNLTKNAEGKTF